MVLKILGLENDEIDVSRLSGGAYLLQLATEKGVVQKKLVVY